MTKDTSQSGKQARQSFHDYPRDEQIAGLKAIIAFLEANPEFDMPEGMGECLVRTLVHENRGELQDKPSKAAWFRRQVEILQPDRIESGTDFDAIKDFGGGTKIAVHVSAEAVCEKVVESQVVSQPVTVTETTWRAPDGLLELGFVPDQDKLRKRDANYSQWLQQSDRPNPAT